MLQENICFFLLHFVLYYAFSYSTIDDAGLILCDTTNNYLISMHSFYSSLQYKYKYMNIFMSFSIVQLFSSSMSPSIGFHSQLKEFLKEEPRVLMCIWTATSKHVNKSTSDTLTAPSSHSFSKCLYRS